MVHRPVPAERDRSASLALPPGHEAAVEALVPGSALLMVHQGAAAGARFLLNQPTVSVGREPRSDIFLNDATVSRHHAVFVREGDGFRVQDENSLNGTYVNGAGVRSAALAAGDEVRVGKYRLTYYPAPR